MKNQNLVIAALVVLVVVMLNAAVSEPAVRVYNATASTPPYMPYPVSNIRLDGRPVINLGATEQKLVTLKGEPGVNIKKITWTEKGINYELVPDPPLNIPKSQLQSEIPIGFFGNGQYVLGQGDMKQGTRRK